MKDIFTFVGYQDGTSKMPDSEKSRLKMVVQRLCKAGPEKLEMHVTKIKQKRNLSQNNSFYGNVGLIADETGYTKEEVKKMAHMYAYNLTGDEKYGSWKKDLNGNDFFECGTSKDENLYPNHMLDWTYDKIRFLNESRDPDNQIKPYLDDNKTGGKK